MPEPEPSATTIEVKRHEDVRGHRTWHKRGAGSQPGLGGKGAQVERGDDKRSIWRGDGRGL